MEILYQTFGHYLTIIEESLSKAKQEKNPAKWLYENNFRTPLFMLEALSRVYKKISDKEIFENLNQHFKQSEDLIGAIDYFYYYAKVFDDEHVKKDLIIKAEEKEREYNQVLIDKGWLDGVRLQKIRKKLAEIPSSPIDEEVSAIRHFYQNQIDKISAFSQSDDFKFEDMEKDIHEIRRNLRWLSIYPQAFLGLFKYADAKEQTPEHIKKYLTDKIINSPYNVFPSVLTFKEHIKINKQYFLALSWIIDAIGDLKDEGLKFEALEIVHHGNTDKQEITKLLEQSKKILIPFFEEKILNHLLS